MLFCTCRCVVECVYACDVCTEKVTGVVALCALYYSILHKIPVAVMYLFIVSLLIQIICNFFFICNIVLLFHYLIQIICYISSNVIANICDFLRIMRNLLVPCGPVEPVSPSRPAMSWWFHINQEKGASYCCLNRPWCLETGAQFSSVGYDSFANIMPLLILHFLKLRSNTFSILH